MASNSAGGVFLPGDPPPSTGQVLTSPMITSAVLVSPTITGSPTIAAGAAMAFNVAAMTATGATGTDSTAVSVTMPALITVTGATNAGIGLPVPTAGQLAFIKNLGTGATKVYCVGGTINGTTGTTAYTITMTGTQGSAFMCVTAGAWQVAPLIT